MEWDFEQGNVFQHHQVNSQLVSEEEEENT